ncbi:MULTISPECIES: hypothetical protein [Carboxydocella]|uniref:Uncharacterized protein n=2 Tax=Carboxydocella TaxID=178898 RepID=A0A1T4PSJ7_9FIRM|nr:MULTISPECIES: hypothetical protein [Carboxydocella]AVX19674.1 hypothetical protein CFE_0475 [Carboxydocella thermautotrophica]AVX30079.1 hypothetical protein CTH_0476 [Carboxydocella thermautotrophica]GAW31322.1 acetamidase/formamidase [Carboxydocella sp. JDF658]SJZ94256.1 hypothetical protein SAMN02745885_01386 [Carboxydocella sporoproducens DSM 16521]
MEEIQLQIPVCPVTHREPNRFSWQISKYLPQARTGHVLAVEIQQLLHFKIPSSLLLGLTGLKLSSHLLADFNRHGGWFWPITIKAGWTAYLPVSECQPLLYLGPIAVPSMVSASYCREAPPCQVDIKMSLLDDFPLQGPVLEAPNALIFLVSHSSSKTAWNTALQRATLCLQKNLGLVFSRAQALAREVGSWQICNNQQTLVAFSLPRRLIAHPYKIIAL